MKYENYIKQTYSTNDILINNGTAILYGSDGNSYYVSEVNPHYNNGSPFEETLGYYANYFNRNYASSSNSDLIAIAYMDDRDLISILVNNKVDFLLFNNTSNSSTCYVEAVDYKASNGSYYVIEDPSALSDYLRYDGNDGSPFAYSTISYDNYYATLNNNHSKSVFDFSNIRGDNYRSNSLAIRGENMAFYNYGFVLTGNVDYLEFSYGTPYYDIENEAYNRGYGNGTNTGYINGYNTGYNDGVIASGVDGNTANAFNYLGKAFECVGGIMALEVLPHISLGLCFSIPLTLVLIMTIFKMVKK